MMRNSSSLLRQARSLNLSSSGIRRNLRPTIFQSCPACRHISSTPRAQAQPADNPDFMSIVDNPPNLVRSGKRHGPGLIILALIPITAFALGTWQVQRLDWKSKLIAKFEDRLVRDPLPLPQQIDPSAIHDFDYRRIYATGIFRHDQEMLIGPRMHDGTDGYLVITPLERKGKGATVLVNRGWISKKLKRQDKRPDGLPSGVVTVEGLLREPWKKNMFTPENRPEKGEFYFPDVVQMAELTGSQAVWVEETMESDLLRSWDREAKGIPIGRPAEVNLRNNHSQYIFTWYCLAAATSVMLWMVVKKPPQDIARRVRQNKEWS
ncbi:related to SURF1 protein [Rhynchosporium agropyri]|uniref:SURF1-like protein n=2 Tax=Rhynchosporium TaxID=38037 RepID=A0A1E1KJL8_9HELO|nr:related to SURF1 protein [Rhynchosporium agropyri]CZT04942.1 related to SURF1 protein [Rhynchosporium commune]